MYLEELVFIVGVEMYLLDVIDDDVIKVLVVKVGIIDVFFNCVGYVVVGNILECDDKVWDFFFNFNVKVMFYIICVVLLGMLVKKVGFIVNIVLVVLSVKGVVNCFVYGVFKVVVVGLIKLVVVDFVVQGICCNVICLGIIELFLLNQCISM